MILNPYRFAAGTAVPAPLHWWNLTDLKLGLWDYGSGEFGKLATSSAGVTVETDQPDGAGDCIEFDNSGTPDGYVTTLTDQAWDGAGNDISISCWIAFPTGSTYINKPFFSWYNSSPDDRLVVMNVAAANNAWLAKFFDTGTNSASAIDPAEDPAADGTWYHVVATYNGTTDTASLYVDDTFIDSTTDALMGALEDQPMPLAIGARADAPTTTGIDARMFSLSIYDKVLDADERSALYNSGNGGTYADFFGATPAIGTNPTTTDLFAWWKLEDVNDAHGSNTPPNNGTTTFTAGYNDNAATFNGSSQYLSDTAQSVYPTGAQTWACWVKVSADVNADIMSWFGDSGNRAINVVYQATTDTINVNISGNGSTLVSKAANATVALDGWLHVAVVYVPSTSLTIYINGIQSAQETSSIPSSLHNASADFLIGARDTSTVSRYLDGQVDDACIFSKALSAEEVKWLVANTYSDF